LHTIGIPCVHHVIVFGNIGEVGSKGRALSVARAEKGRDNRGGNRSIDNVAISHRSSRARRSTGLVTLIVQGQIGLLDVRQDTYLPSSPVATSVVVAGRKHSLVVVDVVHRQPNLLIERPVATIQPKSR
jgi:hypothetical protein